jgi:hypothetical protein
MRQDLLDTTVFSALLRGRLGAVYLIQPWIFSREVVTNMLLYGEVIAYLRGLTDVPRRDSRCRGDGG